MTADAAEQIYQFAGYGAMACGFASLFWMHRSFYHRALLEHPETLSLAHLRRILVWGKVMHRVNYNNENGQEALDRMAAALVEIRRRRTLPS
jgi:hypothetical protein